MRKKHNQLHDHRTQKVCRWWNLDQTKDRKARKRREGGGEDEGDTGDEEGEETGDEDEGESGDEEGDEEGEEEGEEEGQGELEAFAYNKMSTTVGNIRTLCTLMGFNQPFRLDFVPHESLSLHPLARMCLPK